jgi:hypothetical protein
MGMNTTEVTMEHITTPSPKLAAPRSHNAPRKSSIELATTVRGPLKPVADQLIRAVSSVALNLAEGAGHIGGSRSTTGGSRTDQLSSRVPHWDCCKLLARSTTSGRVKLKRSSTGVGR